MNSRLLSRVFAVARRPLVARSNGFNRRLFCQQRPADGRLLTPRTRTSCATWSTRTSKTAAASCSLSRTTRRCGRSCRPLQRMVDEGVLIDFVRDALITSPDLLRAFVTNGPRVMEVLDLLVEACSFTYESALRTQTNSCKSTGTDSSTESSCSPAAASLSGAQLGRIVRECPAVLFASTPAQIETNIGGIASFFSQRDIVRLLTNVPHLILRPFEEMEQKFEYVYFHMRIEADELSAAIEWVDIPLDEIMMRHQFLLKTGKYVTPDPKKPQLKKDNPPCYRITDTNDQTFAVEVAGVTVEEWMVFRQLYEKQQQLEDKEQPFERVKPSVRKAWERRLKKAEEAEEHEF
ncbi:MTERF domain-containing protein 2 [Aphelenchoides fujianensis]|nr:MTERF domain-containing protein 2 [Aphelenchoides fujianensis]